jgi:hypothetical protein
VSPAWGYRPWSEGRPLPAGYSYTSDTNHDFLTPAAMRSLVDG